MYEKCVTLKYGIVFTFRVGLNSLTRVLLFIA